MRVTIRLFARLKDIVGAGELQRAATPGVTAQDLWRMLVVEYPELERYGGSISCAVNQEYAKLSTRLSDRDEVAFLPPVSGG